MPSMVDMLLPAIYIKLSDERRRLTRITYNEIFNLVFIKDKLERDRYYSNLFSKSDLYKILGLIDKKQQKYTNNEVELRLIDFIKISTLDSYINYHVIRSNQFKKNVYFSLGKFNEFYLRGYSYSKSDEVYSYILQSLSMKSNNDLSDMDFKEIINSVKSVFYENKHIERDYEIKNKMLNLIKKERENKYEELSIYWGTNRKPGQYENGLYFDNRRNDSSQQDHEISVGHSLVTIPSKHKSGLIEKKKKWWGFWRNKKEDINNYIVIHSHESMEKNDWQNAIRKEKDDSEGLLFIHGYNCSFDDGIYRSAQLKYDLKFSGPTFCFSWASAANVASYMKDETTVDWSSVHLKEFLYLIKSGLKLSKLHIIAHSMGSRLLVSIIDELKQEIDFIHTIVFAG